MNYKVMVNREVPDDKYFYINTKFVAKPEDSGILLFDSDNIPYLAIKDNVGPFETLLINLTHPNGFLYPSAYSKCLFRLPYKGETVELRGLS